MKTRKTISALVRRNAEACANAWKPRCTCQCKRTLHRKPHSEEWMQETIERLVAEHEAETGEALE